MQDKIPTFQVPQRIVRMRNGEDWLFAFDNRALHFLDSHYEGSPSGSLEMYHALTATHQKRNGCPVDLDTFIDDLLPPLIDPEVKAKLEGLLTEVQTINKAATGNAVPAAMASQNQPQPAGSDATTTAE